LEIIVFTQPDYWDYETKVIEKFFKAGLMTLHIRKPEYSTEQMMEYIESVPHKYRNRLVIHSHHELAIQYGLKGIHITEGHRKEKRWLNIKIFIYRLLRPKLTLSTSFHSLNSFKKVKRKYSYVILSPVFESISKKDHKPTVSLAKIEETLRKTKYRVVAVGGLDESNVTTANQMGFYGAGLLGSIWKDDHPEEKFNRIMDLCKGHTL
jgi:thiamine-phosphate pyrophosphorylase